MSKLLFALRVVFGGAFLALILCWVNLYNTYNATGAIQPNIRTGQIIALNMHGYVSYITKQQRNNMRYLVASAFLCFLLVGFIGYVHKKRVAKVTHQR